MILLALLTVGAIALPDRAVLTAVATDALEVGRARAKELELEAIDFESDDVKLKLLKSFQGFSMLFKVKQKIADKWVTVGVFKPTSGNTYAAAEVATYRLGKYLGHRIYPVTVPRRLGPVAMKRVLALIQNRHYEGEVKERGRRRTVGACLRHLAKGTGLPVAFKEWVRGFQPLRSGGFYELKSSYRLRDNMSCRKPQPTWDAVTLENRDGGAAPGLYTGSTTFYELASDVSSMMLIDVVSTQNDRWPGANTHFRTHSGHFTRVEKRRYDGGPARLMALDNGAAFMGSTVSRVHLARHVTRFDPALVARLRELQEWTEADPAAVTTWLTVHARGMKAFREGLQWLLEYIETTARKCPSGAAWFAPGPRPLPARPVMGPPAPPRKGDRTPAPG